MFSKFSATKLLILLLLVSTLLSACRSKNNLQPRSQPPVPPSSNVSTVPVPSNDFIVPSDADALPNDLSELNALARQRGWLQDAFFHYDEAGLTPEARRALDSSAKWLRENRYHLIIEGHADERGTEGYNLALGERRAYSAKNYLVSLGVDPQRIQTISYGELKPFSTDGGESGWSQNRRAHLTLTN